MLTNTGQPFEALYPSGAPVEIEVEVPGFNMSGTSGYFVMTVSTTAGFAGYDTQSGLLTSTDDSGPFEGHGTFTDMTFAEDESGPFDDYSTGTAFV